MTTNNPEKKQNMNTTPTRVKKVVKPVKPKNSKHDNFNLANLQEKSIEEISKIALDFQIEGVGSLTRGELIDAIVQAQADTSVKVSGYLEIIQNNANNCFGFLRSPSYNYTPSPHDFYLNKGQIRRYSLRNGDKIEGITHPGKNNISEILKINDLNTEEKKKITPFEDLTPDFPTRRLILENDKNKDNLSMRTLDLVCPIGFGQRGLIVAPPKSGKTILLQNLANSITANHPEATLIVLLIDERPEEVTDMKRMIKGEVISSTFDEPHERHIQVAEMTIEKAKRLTECGKDVIILLDSITRLARAYNTGQPHSGKILSGGIDANALYKPKRFFGAARNIANKNSGSLTILATALIDTGSKMDEVIFEEFKGTGNMEVHLDRSLAERRIYPAINIARSGTRKEELLLHPDEKEKMWKLRRIMINGGNEMANETVMTNFINQLKKSSSNIQFLMTFDK